MIDTSFLLIFASIKFYEFSDFMNLIWDAHTKIPRNLIPFLKNKNKKNFKDVLSPGVF